MLFWTDNFTEPKRIFVGAQRTNFTGSVISYSDAKIASVRAWYSYLDNETMQAHGKNSNTYGVLHPLKNSNFINDNSTLETKIPQIKTLLLNWNMDNVTGSDASGQFYIDDFSSGSSQALGYGAIGSVLKNNYSAKKWNFLWRPLARISMLLSIVLTIRIMQDPTVNPTPECR